MEMQASNNQPLRSPEKLEGADRTRSGSAECVGAELEGVQIPQAASCISMMARDRQLPACKLPKVQHYSFFC